MEHFNLRATTRQLAEDTGEIGGGGGMSLFKDLKVEPIRNVLNEKRWVVRIYVLEGTDRSYYLTAGLDWEQDKRDADKFRFKWTALRAGRRYLRRNAREKWLT